MRDLTRAVSLIIIVILTSITPLFGQEKPAERDSTFEVYHSEVWDKIEKVRVIDLADENNVNFWRWSLFCPLPQPLSRAGEGRRGEGETIKS